MEAKRNRQAPYLALAFQADAGRPIEFHHYPGTGHWFFEADRTDAFNADAAKMAWERTLAFLKRPQAFGNDSPP
jgi:dienelactone hydrolase